MITSRSGQWRVPLAHPLDKWSGSDSVFGSNPSGDGSNQTRRSGLVACLD
eukprot:CAMPEP_0169386726 /NCGR_PEP_ID=MMETSP1017-20121227/44941_1 /TAXON_ID=342587 /ORGANISM="Karlodinium micrum, Strain CCMP2283" /LENGTH=49 /DNA_ID= /DNA_START= /DNA_END= /DNA_ORIENTATION=